MGVDGMSNADIFDEYFDDEKPKYVIRNCPARLPSGFCIEAPKKKAYLCQDCTDCKLKQIVELAKGHTELCKNCEQQIKECDCSDICNAYRLDKILKLLDIEECE